MEFGSRAVVDAGALWVDSKSSLQLLNASPLYQTNIDSGLKDTLLLANSRFHGYNEFCITGQVLGTDLNVLWSMTVTAGQWAGVGTVYTNNGNSYTVVAPFTTSATTILVSGPAIPATGTLTWSSGTNSSQANITMSAFAPSPSTIYTFTIATAASFPAGAQFTNNGFTFTNLYTTSSSTTLVCVGTGSPASATSGTLTAVSGTGAGSSPTISACKGSTPLVILQPATPVQASTSQLWTGAGGQMQQVYAGQQAIYYFTITSASVDAGAVYQCNGNTFINMGPISSGTLCAMVGTGSPGLSGTLTWVQGCPGGTNTGNLTFSAVQVSSVPSFGPAPGQAGIGPVVPAGLRVYVTDLFITTDPIGLAGATNTKLADTSFVGGPFNSASGLPLGVFTTLTVAAQGASQVVIEANSGHTLGPAWAIGSAPGQGLMWWGTGVFTGTGTFTYRIKGYFAP
jgi:hypothetical protein